MTTPRSNTQRNHALRLSALNLVRKFHRGESILPEDVSQEISSLVAQWSSKDSGLQDKRWALEAAIAAGNAGLPVLPLALEDAELQEFAAKLLQAAMSNNKLKKAALVEIDSSTYLVGSVEFLESDDDALLERIFHGLRSLAVSLPVIGDNKQVDSICGDILMVKPELASRVLASQLLASRSENQFPIEQSIYEFYVGTV